MTGIDFFAVEWPSGVSRVLSFAEYVACTDEELARTHVTPATRLDFLRARRVGRGGAA